MRTKRVLSVSAVIALLAIAAGCGSDDAAETTDAPATTPAAADTTAAPVTTTASADTAATTAPAVTEAPTTVPAYQAEWDDLVAAAKDEGELVVAAGPEGNEQDLAWYQAFGDEFGIKITMIAGATNDIVTRLLAEREQNIFSVDVASLGGTGTNRLLEAGVFAPLEPLLFHPEALDRSTGWRIDHFPWVDETNKFATYVGETSGTGNFTEFFYNTDVVSQEMIDSLHSWQDLLKPEWKGLIGTGDIASGDAGGDRVATWGTLGKDFFDKLFTTQDVHVSLYGSARDQADALARGEIGLALFPAGTQEMIDAKDQGLPIEELLRTLDEGATRDFAQRLGQMDSPPHPNVAKLFVNWALAKDGMTAYNQFSGRMDTVSLRSDVPQGTRPDDVWEAANSDKGIFLDENTDEYRADDAESIAFFKQLFESLHIVPGS